MPGPATAPDSASIERAVLRLDGDGSMRREPDRLAVEAPLEIVVNGTPIATTMRTPGHDEELVAGFLVAEGIAASSEAVAGIVATEGRVEVALAPGVRFAPSAHARHVVASSACGTCSRVLVDVLGDVPVGIDDPMRVSAAVLGRLPAALRSAQTLFATTGGTHAAGLFDAEGRLHVLREDVGRHNAVDKVVGRRLLDDALPVRGGILVVSGRASFEIVQKAARAGIAVIGSVSAASDLAASCAERAGITLAAFVRDGGMVVMTRPERIRS